LLNPIMALCPTGVETCLNYDANHRSTPNTRRIGQSAELVDLAFFRLAPPELKASVYNENRWQIRSHFEVASPEESSDLALEDFAAHVRRGAAGKTATFLHLFSTHAPASRHADCTPLETPLPITRTTAMGVATCALSRVGALMENLEARNLSDQTSVVLLSDHGYRPGTVPSPRTDDPNHSTLLGNANPTLAVKPAGRGGPFATNDAQLSLTDVRTIVCDLTDACPTAYDWRRPDPARTRSYMAYEWSDAFWSAATLKGERRFEVRGEITDPSAWTELERGELPFVSQLTFGSDDSAANFGYGWGPVQATEGDDARWALGQRASLMLNLPAEAATELRFRVGALPEYDRQAITFKLNGTEIGRADVRGLNDEISVVVPAGVADEDIDELLMSFDQYRDPGADENRHRRLARAFAVRFDHLEVGTP
jgi:hypothetical protein